MADEMIRPGDQDAAGRIERLKAEGHGSYTQIVIMSEMQTTRVANNRITECHGGEESGMAVVSEIEGSMNVTSFSIGDEDFFSTHLRGLRSARNQQPIPWFKGFPPIERKVVRRYMRMTGDEERAEAALGAIRAAQAAGYNLSGVIASTKANIKTGNSTSAVPRDDIMQWMGSQLYFSFAVTDADNRIEAGAGGIGTTIKNSRLEAKVAEAIEHLKLQESLPLRDIPPGQYDVVMAGPCCSHILQYASWFGFGGGFKERGWGFTAGNEIGDKIFGDNISITDNPYDSRHPIWVPGDMMGIPRRKQYFVTNGMLMSVWHDFWTAQKHGKRPTGHGYTIGYGPTHLELRRGKGPTQLRTAARELGNGLVISDMNYTRMHEVADGSFQGTTRHGTFIVENGKIVARGPDVRFFDSVPHILNNVRWLSSKQGMYLPPEIVEFGPIPGTIAPRYIQVDGFNVIGSTPLDMVK